MRLVDGIGKLVAELIENSLDPVVVLLSNELADDPLEPIPGGLESAMSRGGKHRCVEVDVKCGK